MSTWNYIKDGQKQEPVETAELQALLSKGDLPPSTLVWKQGMANWAAANSLPEFSASNEAPAVLSGAPAIPPAGSPAPTNETPDPSDVEKNKIMGVLAYLGILFLVPLLAARQSRFAMYHTNQGLILFIAWFVLNIAAIVISYLPFVGWIISLLVLPVLMLGGLVFVVLGILNAANGVCKPLPLIGDRFTLIK